MNIRSRSIQGPKLKSHKVSNKKNKSSSKTTWKKWKKWKTSLVKDHDIDVLLNTVSRQSLSNN